MTKGQLNKLVEGLVETDLRTLRAIINGKISKRTITPEQQAKMQAGRKPRTRLCWLCNRKFQGNHFAEVEIDGHLRELHKGCAKEQETP